MLLSLLTLVLFTLMGAGLMIWRQSVSLLQLLQTGDVWYWQVIYGLGYGVGMGLIGISISETEFMQPIKAFFREVFNVPDIGIKEIVFISACAGIGEEILFRGAIQYELGIWLTALVFVAIHGYLRFNNLPFATYGIFLVVMCAGLGYLYVYVGLLCAIVAHTVYDVMMFVYLLHWKQNQIG